MKTDTPPVDSARWLTFLIVAGSSICFCTKGVFAKLAYAEGADSLTVLALRMGMALPVLLVGAWWSGGANGPALSMGDWGRLTGLGFLGYYFSSFVNFTGLQYISVGLERIILYTYPSLVLLGSALWFRRAVPGVIWTALAVTYAGIVCAFAGEARITSVPTGRLAIGMSLIFLSAVTYAVFILLSGELLRRMGALRFMSHVVGLSAVMILVHFAVTHPLRQLVELTPRVYFYGAVLAVLGTLVPSYLLGVGLKRAGAQRFALIGTVGPVTTLILARLLLKEPLHALQLAGFILSLAGGLAVALMKATGPKPTTAATAAGKGATAELNSAVPESPPS